MDWSLRRQFMVVIIIIAIIAIIVGVIFWYLIFAKKPTCNDFRHNGDETGVDCGGSCPLLCYEEAIPPIELWSTSLPVTKDIHHLVAYVENQNPNYAIENLEYKFTVYDNEGGIIEEREGVTDLPPNQRSYIFEPVLQIDANEPDVVFFSIENKEVWRRAPNKFFDTTLRIENSQIDLEGVIPKVTADIRNISEYNISDIDIVAVLYDINNNAVAVSGTKLESLRRGQTEPLIFTWPILFDEEPVRVDIVPHINVFHENNQ